MPPLADVPNVIRFRVNWTIDGDPMGNTILYYKYSGGPPGSSNLATMAASMVTQLDNYFGASCTDHVGVSSCEATDLSSATAGQGVGGAPWLGTGGTDMLPPGAAMLVNHYIARRYRGGKPRTYLPIGLPSWLTTAGLWNTTNTAAVNTAWASFNGAMLGAGVGCTLTNLVNVSYFQGFTVTTSPTTGRARNTPKPRATPLVDNITASLASVVVGSQRRRNRDA